VAEGRYTSAEDYVSGLIRAERRRRAKEKVEALLLEGLNSGAPTPMTADDWANLRRKFVDRLARDDAQ
jgi:antitoxin ParD1/3/4